MSNVAISTRLQQGIWIIKVAGELTSQDEESLSAAYPWLHPPENGRMILFDMSHLSYINSSGIALLIRFVRESSPIPNQIKEKIVPIPQWHNKRRAMANLYFPSSMNAPRLPS